MSFGLTKKILRVNLTSGEFYIEEPNDKFYRKYIGGEGLIAYYLLKELEPNIDPLSPENKLIFATGPITGVPLAGSGRNSIGAKSPLTGGFGEAEVGGYWGPELKRAGFDAIIIEGKASNPVFLWINDSKVEIRDAAHIWGKITGDTQEFIKDELNDDLVRIAMIGPGGENLVRYACIINELRFAAGRTGMGAVMGSKNLKAIAVKGSERIKIANKDKLRELRNKLNNIYLKPVKGWFSHGTGGGIIETFASTGNLPTRNFRDGNFENPKNIDPQIVSERINLRMETCYSCPIQCKKIVDIDEKWNVNPKYGGPEYETIGSFGSNCGIDDPVAICKAHELCNKYSLDTISTGVTISFAMECYENGILTADSTNGMELDFGNSDAMLELISMIANREGIGNLLAEGTKRVSQNLGKDAERFAIHVKGQEVPMHEPRLKRALGLGYAISPTGAEHMHNLHDTSIVEERSIGSMNQFGIYEALPLDDLSPKKVRALSYQMNWKTLGNSLILCYFTPWTMQDQNTILQAVTGWNSTTWELMKTGERIFNLIRTFNIKHGFNKEEDWLPERFFQPHTSGALSDSAIDKNKLSEARNMYYEMNGWDEMGVPKKAKLEELDVSWAISHLSKR